MMMMMMFFASTFLDYLLEKNKSQSKEH